MLINPFSFYRNRTHAIVYSRPALNNDKLKHMLQQIIESINQFNVMYTNHFSYKTKYIN